jgi:hypothetical protein
MLGECRKDVDEAGVVVLLDDPRRRESARGGHGAMIAPSVTVPVVMPPKMARSYVTAKPAVQQILPFSAVIFDLGNGTAPLPRGLLRIR